MNLRVRLAVVAALALLLSAAALIYNTSTAVSDARVATRSAGTFAFAERKLIRNAASNVEILSTPAVFSDAALFQGKLYVAGPTGLFTAAESFTVGDYLPPAPITAIAAGLRGSMAEPTLWLATSGEGFLSFDGETFSHVRPEAAEHRKLTSVLPLSTGRILFGTEKAGVLVYDGNRLSSLHENIGPIHITALAGDDSGVWIGTLDRGLLHWHAGQVDVYDQLPDKHVLSIASFGDHAFAGTAVGVAVVSGGKVQRTLAEGTFARSVWTDGKRLLIGTLEQGILELPLPSGRTRFYDSEDSIHRIISAGGRLLALSSGGVRDVRSSESVLTPQGAQLHDRNISALSSDRDGRLWVGYFDKGLDVVEPGWRSVRHIEDEHLFCVNKIAHTSDMHVVATANGLVMLDSDGRKRQVLGREGGLIANHITDVAIEEGRLTVATPAGITFLERGGPRSLYVLHGLVNNHAYALGQANGKLLVGTLGGLSLIEGGFVQASYTTGNSPLRHNWVTALASMNDEWFIGTYGAGVLALDRSGKWRTFEGMEGVEINPNAIHVADGRLFAGTLTRGLLVYEGGRWRPIATGLPSLSVTAITSHAGQLVVGTDNGLVRIR